MAEDKNKIKEEEDYEKYEADTRKVASVNKGTIGKAIEGLSEQMKAYKFDMFVKKMASEGIDVSEITDESKIPEDKRSEFADYKLSDKEISSSDSPYLKAKNDIIHTLEKRDKTLNELVGEKEKEGKGKLQELLENATSKKSELEEKLKSPELSDDDRASLEDQIERLNRVIDGIGDTEKGLINDCETSKKATQGTKKEAIKILASSVEPYALSGRAAVYEDADITNALGKYDEEKDYLENVTKKIDDVGNNEKKEEENKDQQDKEKDKEKNGNDNPVMAGASPKQQGAAGFVPQQGGVSQGIPGEGVEQGEPAEKPEPSGMSYLSDLGYTGEVLKAGTSISLLKSFVDADQKTQLAILKDNEAQKVVFEAMKKANNRWTPLSAIKFNKTRRALIDMANGPMMRKALETIGKDVDYTNLDSLDDKFKGALKEYQENRDQKQKEIDSLPDGEEKSKLQAELDAFDKEYSAITGVSEFRNISNNELNRFRDRVVDKMSNVFNRNQYDKISAPSKKQVANEKGEDLKNRTTRIVSDDRNRYIENLQNNTVSIKDQAKNAAARGNKNIDRNINEQVVDDQVIDEQDLNR